ncbi:ATP-binding protein [Terrabacter sp. C0L_2]|uniref:ATP-binding protein n=1 Tax=Terrabacter sp. C0L_2 TaxID=3108389 RepID=UPI002ED3F790|nr:ATP-binding protein [Terrabacter sp. C0L_2]
MTGPSVASERELGRVEFGPDDLRRVREVVRTIVVERLPDRADNAVLAVHEVAVNSIVHGGGHGVLRIDETADSIVFTVEDEDGTGSVPQLRAVDGEATSGRGLLIAQRLADRLTIETQPTRTRVRVHLSLAS